MIEPTEADIGREVIYREPGEHPGRKIESGIITSFTAEHVNVRYSGSTSAATKREDLDWATSARRTGRHRPLPEAAYAAAREADPALITDLYLIWSNEHGGWWKPNRHGYTPKLSEAGRFSHRDATLTCVRGIMGTASELGMLPDLPVRAADVRLVADLFDPDDTPQPWR